MRASPPCRSCGTLDLSAVLSLGTTPLANALLGADELERHEPRFPLDLAVCGNCSLVQLLETVPPEQLFQTYVYFSSFSDTMLRHARDLAGRLTAERALNGGSLVVEVASNDGYLLQHYAAAGIPVLGIEPAANIAAVATARGVPTRTEFFGASLADTLAAEGLCADVVHAHNVLAHVPDLNGFVGGLRQVLKPDGIVIVEVPYVKDMLDRCEFDTIYHEHVSYFSATALDALFSRHRLTLYDVERLPIHGGSLRLFAGSADRKLARSRTVVELLAEEAQWVRRLDEYRRFARRVETVKSSLTAMLSELKAAGRRIAAYGAAAKGSTLVNYCGIGSDIVDFVVDRSPYKQGRYMPGAHIPISGPERLLADSPDYVLLLTWNFADEILEQQAEYRRRGGRFIVPVPDVRVV